MNMCLLKQAIFKKNAFYTPTRDRGWTLILIVTAFVSTSAHSFFFRKKFETFQTISASTG